MLPFNRDKVYDAASIILFRAIKSGGGILTDQRQALIDQTIRRLKLSGVWYKLDALYIFAAADAVSALVNWKVPGTFNASVSDAPTFAADRGYTGDGVNDYIDSNFNPTTAPSPKFTQNSATVFSRCRNNLLDKPLWGNAGNAQNALYPRLTGNNASMRINSAGASVTAASTDATGFWATARSGAASQELFKNGVSVGSNTSASAVVNASLYSLRTNTEYSTHQAASFGFGQYLDATEQNALEDAELAYMQAVGAA